MDALDLLLADHNRVRGLFSRFKDAHENSDERTAASLATEMFNELNVRTTIEEEIFYPWARDLSSEISESIDEGLQEHHLAKTLIEEAEAIAAASDERNAKPVVLIESVEHHAGEEEKEMFPKVRSNSSVTDRHDLGERLEARKADLGAPVLADKIDLTTDELSQLAADQDIPGRSKMNHDELAATVSPK